MQRYFRRAHAIRGGLRDGRRTLNSQLRNISNTGLSLLSKPYSFKKAAQHHLRVRAFSSTSDKGLFSIKNLKQPSDFVKLAGEAMAECNSFRGILASQIDTPVTSKQQVSEILFVLDSISKHVCNVIDAAELCRCVHSSPQWRESASNAFAVLSDYIGQLNADTTLYNSLTKVTSSPDIFLNLSEEQQRFANLLKAEFERDGIHLPDSERDHVCQLQSHVVQLESLFQENITNSRKLFDVEAAWVEEIMPRDVLEAYVPQSGAPGKVTLSTDAQISNTLGRFSANPMLRKEVYMETMTSCPENLQVLEALRQVRHEAATAQGFPSFAHRVLKDRMAETPETVHDFLDNLQIRIREPYRKDMETIANAKTLVEGKTSGPVEPWDISFYTGILKARSGFDAAEVAKYFTIPNCIEGMKLLVKELFGIAMEEETMTAEERWDSDIPKELQARKFVFVLEETQERMGTMYLDLHPREGKYVHAAHFTVLCGCAETVDAQDFQRPVVALVCNLSASEHGGSSDIVSHSEVETLFHEFGHALHSLLSRTTFQHLSGTRAAMDFVETPSHLLEHYVWDTQFLSKMARHHVTGEPMPAELMQLLRQSRNEFKSLDVQNQILYSRFDQALFGPVPASGGLVPSTEVFAGLYGDLTGIQYPEGTHWHTRFGHLVTYGAGYYGYLYAQAFAADLFHTTADNPLSRQWGERVWRDLLGQGGARDPHVMLRGLLGREPSVEAMFQEMGMVDDKKEP
jgi:intermediate peptidase